MFEGDVDLNASRSLLCLIYKSTVSVHILNRLLFSLNSIVLGLGSRSSIVLDGLCSEAVSECLALGLLFLTTWSLSPEMI